MTRPSKPQASQPTPEWISTGSKVLGPSNFLELVRHPGTGQIRLLHWCEGSAQVAEHIVVNDRRYRATQDSECLERLPTEPSAHGGADALFSDLSQFIATNSGVGGDDAALLAFFSVATFFAECFSIAPCLLIFGAPLPAIFLLRILACTCRHAVLCRASSIPRTMRGMRPTRLICQADGGLARLLPALQLDVGAVSTAGGTTHTGPSAVYVGDSRPNTGFADLALEQWVSPSNGSFARHEEEQQADVIQQLQNRLLMYRLQNFHTVKNSTFDVPEFSNTTREYARMLGRCIGGAPQLQARLIALLQSRDDAERTETSCGIEAVVTEALVVCCHERRQSVHVGEIAELTNAILGREGERLEMSARHVGGVLRRLGIRTSRLDAGGRGIYLLKEQCARIHELGRAFGIPTLRRGLSGCPHCMNGK